MLPAVVACCTRVVLAAQHAGHRATPGTPAAAPTKGRFGRVVFPNGGAAATRSPFLEALALLLSFHYDAAAADFRRAEAADPGFTPDAEHALHTADYLLAALALRSDGSPPPGRSPGQASRE